MRFGFFNGQNNYGAEEFARYFENMYQNGVSVDSSNNLGFRVYKYSDTSLRVEKGFALINGYFLYNDTLASLTIAKDTNYSRIDRVVIRLDISNNAVSIILKPGVAATNPVAPALTRNNSIYELSLAQVLITTTGAITITDERYSQSVCGTIRPKNFTEFNDMIKGFESRFNDWFASQQSKGWRNIYIQSGKPTGAVEGSLWYKVLT